MKKLAWVYLVALLCIDCQGQTSFSAEEKDSLRIFYQNRAKNWLQKDTELGKYLKISPEGIKVFAFEDEEEKKDKLEELSLSWEEAIRLRESLLRNPQKTYLYYLEGKIPELLSQKPTMLTDSSKILNDLSGTRIALDPGHMAGSLAEAVKEGKYVKFTHPNGKKISFFESKLAWYTSKILADTLEKLGAEVLLTRDAYHLTALDTTYSDWFINYQKQNPDIKIANKWQFFFKEFKKIEFTKRIEKINDFKPNLTIIIHYNVDATNTGWKKITYRNNSMAFVGGSFMKGELDEPEDRFNMLRQLLGEDIPQSIDFSKNILQAFDNQLGIKKISLQNKQFFLNDYCIYAGEPGVYHRNLNLSRRVYGTLCYAEPLYQDHIQESLKLTQQDLDYQGEKIPKRLQEVAYVYLEGIISYLQQKK